MTDLRLLPSGSPSNLVKSSIHRIFSLTVSSTNFRQFHFVILPIFLVKNMPEELELKTLYLILLIYLF